MRVVMASRVYPPEIAAASYRLRAATVSLLGRGARVTVLTSAAKSAPAAVPVPEHAKLRVRRLPMLQATGAGARRILSFASFDVPLLARLVVSRCDVILAESPPSTVAVAALVGRARGIPVVYYMADLWSEMYRNSNARSARLVAGAIERLESFAVRNCAGVVVVTAALSARLTARHPDAADRIVLIENGIDTELFRPREVPAPPRPVVVYAGTMGVPQGAVVFVDALASLVRDAARSRPPELTLRMIGHGAMKASIEERARDAGLADVEFHDFISPDELAEVLTHATCSLVSLRPDGGVSTAVPTKIFAAAASGCPVLYVGGGTAAQLVADHRLGVVVPTHEPAAVAAAMRSLVEKPWSAGERARLVEWARANASLRTAGERVADVVLHTRSSTPRRPTRHTPARAGSPRASLAARARSAAHFSPLQIAARGRTRLLDRLRTGPGWWAYEPEAPDDRDAPCAVDGAVHFPSPAPPADPQTYYEAPTLSRMALLSLGWAVEAAERGERPEELARRIRALGGLAASDGHTAWHPYVVSSRILALAAIAQSSNASDECRRQFLAQVRRQSRNLSGRLELDVRGNHLVHNYAALAVASMVLRDDRDGRRWLRRFDRELARQLLPDGGHEERAPYYHAHVLADVLTVLATARAHDVETPERLTRTAARMRQFLAAVIGPDGLLPPLSDGYALDPDVLAAMLDATPAPTGSHLLRESGIAVLRAGPWTVTADVGSVGADRQPGHGHADSLSFLVYAGSARVVVESGCSTYEPGARRDAERGTAAHNTVQVDRRDSSEVFGQFRVGRRARTSVTRFSNGPSGTVLEAEHDGYRGGTADVLHRRRWEVDPHRIVITDTLAPGADLPAAGALGFPPGLTLEPEGGALVLRGGRAAYRLRIDGAVEWQVGERHVATGFHETTPGPCVQYSISPGRSAQVTLVSADGGLD